MDRTGKGARRKHRTDAEDERYENKGYLRLREAGAIEVEAMVKDRGRRYVKRKYVQECRE